MPQLHAVDVMGIQHEGTLAQINDTDPATIQFEDPLNFSHTYQEAGIDFITIANNHQYDFGITGLSHTLKTLSSLGIPYGGLGDASSVREPVVVTRHIAQGPVNVAFFTLVVDECWTWPNGTLYLDGCTCGPNADPTSDPPYQCYQANATMPGLWYQFGINDALIKDVSGVVGRYKEQHPETLVVVYLHVGPNFAWVPSVPHQQLLRNISKAGADIVWGTSSHHIQRFEILDGKPIVYGLGDLLFRHVVGVQDWCPIYARTYHVHALCLPLSLQTQNALALLVHLPHIYSATVPARLLQPCGLYQYPALNPLLPIGLLVVACLVTLPATGYAPSHRAVRRLPSRPCTDVRV